MMGLSQVALVDELAHTNVPGSGHNEKRWQDVMEILFEGSGRKDAEQLVRLRQLTSDVALGYPAMRSRTYTRRGSPFSSVPRATAIMR